MRSTLCKRQPVVCSCVRTTLASRGFSVAAPAIRNSLPSGIRDASSTHTFRRFLKLTASSRPSAPPSDSPKCLRFGHWLTLCTLNIHLLTYLLITYCCQGIGKMRTADLRTGVHVMCRPNLRTRSAAYPLIGVNNRRKGRGANSSPEITRSTSPQVRILPVPLLSQAAAWPAGILTCCLRQDSACSCK